MVTIEDVMQNLENIQESSGRDLQDNIEEAWEDFEIDGETEIVIEKCYTGEEMCQDDEDKSGEWSTYITKEGSPRINFQVEKFYTEEDPEEKDYGEDFYAVTKVCLDKNVV